MVTLPDARVNVDLVEGNGAPFSGMIEMLSKLYSCIKFQKMIYSKFYLQCFFNINLVNALLLFFQGGKFIISLDC